MSIHRPAAQRPQPDPLDVVLTYHAITKHHPYRFARSLGYMDWDAQPDPFRRYQGAQLLALDEAPPTPQPSYDALFRPGALPTRPIDRHSLSQLFYDSLALSAWKEFQGQRWSLRVNPSSGNLHPTEGYLIAGPAPGLLARPALCHYAPFQHGLEVRAELHADEWRALTAGLPPASLLIGLTSIYWRESWKYGERAFRYCQHDAGHAIAAIAIAAAALGWKARLLESLTDDELALLLGVQGQSGIEAERADCLLLLHPQSAPLPLPQQRAYRPPPALLARLARTPLAGRPNRLSADHHPWSAIEAVSEASRRTRPPADDFWQQPANSAIWPEQPTTPPPAGRQIIRQRRSAVAMDGVTGLAAETFHRMLQRVTPHPERPPWSALPWQPSVHLALFVHRVDGLAPGLYLLLRDPAQGSALRAALKKTFAWRRPAGCPASLHLYLLEEADCRQVAQAVSCGQEIAAEGAFALAMLAEFAGPIRHHGPWFYKRLHWEAGAIGQVLYLEAEAAGLRATGIGCFFDDSTHQALGLSGPWQPDRPNSGHQADRYQVLYHFTVGGPVEDARLRTIAAYAHRQTSAEEAA